jgi:hypothetical protein
MKMNDEITKSVAETVAELLEKNKIKTETEVQKANKDFVDLHAVDDKEDPEQKKQVESKDEVEDDVEEGNAFGQAVTDAKKAGKKKFKFQGKEYKVESAELEEASASDIKKVLAAAKKAGGTVKGNQIDFGMGSVIDVSIEKDKIKLDGGSSSGVEYFKNAKDAIMTFESIDEGILGKIKDKLNPKKAKAREELTKLAKAQKNLKGVLDKIQAKADKEEDGDKAQEILDKGDKLWLKLDDIESKMAAIRKNFKGIRVVKESVELQEAANFGDIEKVMKWAKKNIVGGGKFPQLDISKKYGTAFINLTIFNIITLRLGGKKGIVVTHDDRTNGKGNAKEEHFSNANEVIKFVEKKYNEMPKKESIDEALKPADFVKGGDAKITKREVDGMLSKLFIDAKLAKAVEASSAFKAGEKSNGKKNPYKKDTADFHLFILGQQSADAE